VIVKRNGSHVKHLRGNRNRTVGDERWKVDKLGSIVRFELVSHRHRAMWSKISTFRRMRSAPRGPSVTSQCRGFSAVSRPSRTGRYTDRAVELGSAAHGTQ